MTITHTMKNICRNFPENTPCTRIWAEIRVCAIEWSQNLFATIFTSTQCTVEMTSCISQRILHSCTISLQFTAPTIHSSTERLLNTRRENAWTKIRVFNWQSQRTQNGNPISACTNACNLQTEKRADKWADWQQAGRCAAGLKCIRQELWSSDTTVR